MENNGEFALKKLDYNGVKILVRWAEEEGWNPGLYDAEIFWTTDPDGYYGYYHNGKLIAGGSIVSYNELFGFMGFFIVHPAYRSSGIGRKLWYQRRDILISRLNEGAPIGMDGVVNMQPFYNKGGFEIAFRGVRHERTGMEYKIDTNISQITEPDLEDILAYDQQCFGFPRPQFLRPWIEQPGVKTFKYFNNDKLGGFAIIRKTAIGYKVSPLFADNAGIAEELYKACLNAAVGEPLYIDIPDINSSGVELAKKYQTRYVFECARMYYGKAPDIPVDKVYGITTFELG